LIMDIGICNIIENSFHKVTGTVLSTDLSH